MTKGGHKGTARRNGSRASAGASRRQTPDAWQTFRRAHPPSSSIVGDMIAGYVELGVDILCDSFAQDVARLGAADPKTLRKLWSGFAGASPRSSRSSADEVAKSRLLLFVYESYKRSLRMWQDYIRLRLRLKRQPDLSSMPRRMHRFLILVSRGRRFQRELRELTEMRPERQGERLQALEYKIKKKRSQVKALEGVTINGAAAMLACGALGRSLLADSEPLLPKGPYKPRVAFALVESARKLCKSRWPGVMASLPRPSMTLTEISRQANPVQRDHRKP